MQFINMILDQVINQGNFSFFILITAVVQILLMLRVTSKTQGNKIQEKLIAHENPR